ncbi:MAG: DUF1553 domain-containing protein, partial [Planctomycetaceae bacterium]|nr:DUF1553 domain-containing protein [Planctomycetaceae bacterium]
DDRYRRGLYTTWRRSNPYPSMATFDAPNREVCTIRRDRTNTPLQALVTLNDPVFVEAAQALGRRALAQPGTLDDQLRYAVLVTLGRPANGKEVKLLAQLYHDTETHFAQNQEAAIQLATDPLGPLPDGVPPSAGAAWTAIGNVLLNLDEVFLKR